MAKACVGEYLEAEEMLLSIHSQRIVEDHYYHAWLSYCLIMNGKAHMAWERYLQIDALYDSFRYILEIASKAAILLLPILNAHL